MSMQNMAFKKDAVRELVRSGMSFDAALEVIGVKPITSKSLEYSRPSKYGGGWPVNLDE